MIALRIFQVTSLLIAILAFVTDEEYIGDVTVEDLSQVISFIANVVWAFIKLVITNVVLLVSILATIPVFIVDIAIENNYLSSMWSWSWNTVSVDWFWHQTKGIELIFIFLMSTTIGFLFPPSN